MNSDEAPAAVLRRTGTPRRAFDFSTDDGDEDV